MKIYISSTFQDLHEHRGAVDRTLRRMGHDVIGMEQYVAEHNKPLDRCLADVRLADIYVVIVAWRYGYLPIDQPPRAVCRSLSSSTARRWLPASRCWLSYSTLTRPGRPAAEAAQGLNRFIVDRVLLQTSVSSDAMGHFGEGTALEDSTIGSIKHMVAPVGSTLAIVVELGDGDRWWLTRLFLLASLLHALSGVTQLVFRDAGARFCGMASPSAVLDRFSAVFPLCAAFLAALRNVEPSLDVERETDRQVALWATIHEPPQGPGEFDAKVGLRADLLERLMGERLVARCIRVDAQGLSLAQVQQIVESPLPDVPIDRLQAEAPVPSYELQVVDRDAFALELAREWVKAGLPRNPIR